MENKQQNQSIEHATQNNQVDNSKTNVQTKPTYCFGHGQDENIWDSFLVNKMFAHRGLFDENCPENTIPAFKNAIEKGYGIELDVQPIADGTPVVFHDSKMSRLTGKDKYIQNLSKEEFENTLLLNSDQKIPTLEEVLSFVDGKVPLLIELKSQDKVGELEPKVFELLKDYKGEFAIQSFNPYQLEWFFKNAPKIWRGQLASYFKGEKLGSLKKFVLKRLGMQKITNQNFVNYDLRYLPNRFTRKLKVPLLSWTIRSQSDYIKAIKVSDNVVFENCEPKI